MSQGDIELIRRYVEAWNEGGVEAVKQFLHPDLEWIDPPELPGAQERHGREAALEFLREWEGSKAIVKLVFQLDEILRCRDGSYLTVTTAHGSGDGGAPIPPHQWFHWVTIDDGKAVRMQLFLDRAKALEAAGLSQ